MAREDDLAAIDAELLPLLESLVGGETLSEFICRVAPNEPPPPHLAPLIRVIERARVRPVRALVSMAPRHGKTVTIVRGLAWHMLKNPRDTHAYVSHSEGFAHLQSRAVRSLAEQTGIELSRDMANLGNWRTTQDGGLYAGGWNAGIIGRPVSGVLVIDDMFSDPLEAASSAVGEAFWQWFTGVAMNRLEGGSVIIVHQRFGENDPIGRLRREQPDRWEYINVPALDENGRAVWPGGRAGTMQAVLDEARALNPWQFEAVQMGRPRPRGGALFREPHYYDPSTFRLDGHRLMIACDPAASEKTSADYSAAVVLAVKGRGAEQEAWVRHVFRAQLKVPALIAELRRLQQQHGCPVAVESVGGFKAIPQMLKALDPKLRVVEIKPMGDKHTRAQSVAAAWNAGRVYVPQGAPWLGPFLAELESFTGVRDLHDDQVDALSHAWNESSQNAAALQLAAFG